MRDVIRPYQEQPARQRGRFGTDELASGFTLVETGQRIDALGYRREETLPAKPEPS